MSLTADRTAVATLTSHQGVEGPATGRPLQVSMLCAGVAIFALLYYPQPLLPALGVTFGQPVWAMSLMVSCTTGALAVAVVAASAVAERIGRVRAMRIGLLSACVLTFAVAAASEWWQVLLLRTLVGVALAGVVATAIGHIGAEADRRQLGAVIGVYIAGTCLGGVAGRIIPGLLVELASWRIAVIAISLLATVSAVMFTAVLPSAPANVSGPAERAVPEPWRPARSRRGRPRPIVELLTDPVIRRLCLIGFCLMGGYVSCLNYIGYRLTEPSFALPVGAASLVFVLAATGMVSSPVAGRFADRYHPRIVTAICIAAVGVGIGLTLTTNLALSVAGLILFTGAFFAAHSVVSAWLSQYAGPHRSTGAALYLTSYYIGSSIIGVLTGLAYQNAGWNGVVATITGLTLVALLATARIATARRPIAFR